MLIWNVCEEWPDTLPGAFRTPKRGAAVMFLSRPVERSYLCQQRQLCPPYRGHTALKIVLRREWPIYLSGFRNRISYLLPQSLYVLEADSDGGAGVLVAVDFFKLFERAEPVRVLDVDGQTYQAVTLRVVEYRVRGIETHRLIVEQRTGVRCDVMKPGVGTRIRDRSKTVGV
jgi:hypothetical protein